MSDYLLRYNLMLDFFCIFTTGGVVLWYKAFFGELKFELINVFIRNILLQEKN